MPSDHHHVTLGCREMADQWYAYQNGRYTAFWSLIGNSRVKLGDIFEFFCEMRRQLEKAPEALRVNLFNRLRARRVGGPLPIPFGHEAAIRDLALLQLEALQKLGKPLTGPAFELFATGALSSQLQVDTLAMNATTAAASVVELPEPDSAAFFLWAEFAFIAAYSGHQPDEWKELLRILIRAERLFALCYGMPVNGVIPASTTFSSYKQHHFKAITFNDAQAVLPPTSDRFDDLERAATDEVLFAFPAGVQ